jgi:hypothetical protein
MALKTDERIEARSAEERRTWWKRRAGRLSLRAWAAITVAVVFFVLEFGAWWRYGRGGHIPR